ncbi:MAG: polyketide synthase [Kiritimatiellae bacterium]|nr:polyketide synthase [Kiritimatiellia bacterium]
MESSIAIVGMSCRFAGCANTAAFWDVVMQQKSMLTLPGPDVELPFGQHNVFDRVFPMRLAQLGELYSCVPAMQNFPRQVNAGENQDLYFATQLAFDALADASMRPHSRETVNGSVRFGYAPAFNASTVNWLQHTFVLDQTMEVIRRFFPTAPEESLDEVKGKLLESLPSPDAASFLLGSGYRFASWLARECSFGGVATIMDAGVLTGAATLMDAVSDLRSGRVDVALTGALTPPLSRSYLEGLSGEVDFSSRHELKPFSQDADGTIPGEGGAFFVLKRREDALRDHDRIYALIKEVAIGHNPDDDPSAIFMVAAKRAGIQPRTVGLIEGDGNGIAASERREVEAINTIWGEHRPGAPLVGLGSVKGNIGHTMRAAMSAGILKAALALHKKVLPPQVETDNPLASISNLSSSAYLLNHARPWIKGDASNPRRAVVLGANFDPVRPIGTASVGGRSATVILEEEPEVRE